MKLFDIFKKRRTPGDLQEALSFLTTDFGFRLIKAETNENYFAKYFLVYRNDDSKMQVEICADENWFDCVFRRIIDGQPARYGDRYNCTGFESLAILETNNNYNTSDYHAGRSGGIGLWAVLRNVERLFKRHHDIFTTDKWVDIKKVEQLKDDEFGKTFGWRPDHDGPTFLGQLKKQSTELLSSRGYKLLYDRDELSPFDRRKIRETLIFIRGDRQIEIRQPDFRDYYLYQIDVNNEMVFEIDVTGQDTIDAVATTVDQLKRLL